MKKMIPKSLALLLITMSAVFFQYVYAVDSISSAFTSQISSWLWSNNSQISVDWNLSYVNKWDNSSVIWNYFIWYYYDSVLWFFQTDWSTNTSENVRVIWSTSKCPNSYGYRIWGYSYSESFGFIDFDFNDDVYVYYCDFDKSFHGYAYSAFLWFQNFEWIQFIIEPSIDQVVELPDEDDDTFINTDTEITNPDLWNESDTNNSNFTVNTIQNDTIEFDTRVESLFYIIK